MKKDLYIVEFGRPNITGGTYYMVGLRSQEPLCVMANSYDEAAEKGLAHTEKNSEPESVIDANGDLVMGQRERDKLTVKSVRLACDNIVW